MTRTVTLLVGPCTNCWLVRVSLVTEIGKISGKCLGTFMMNFKLQSLVGICSHSMLPRHLRASNANVQQRNVIFSYFFLHTDRRKSLQIGEDTC